MMNQNDAMYVKKLLPLAERGELNAQLGLAAIYADDKDYAQAAQWYLKAAEQGDAGAQYAMYLLRALEENMTEAAQWCVMSAAQGDERAMKALRKFSPNTAGIVERGGDELRKLLDGIKEIREIVNGGMALAEQGDPKAQFELGQLYLKGDIMVKDFTKAAQWYLKAAEQGLPEAQYMMFRLYSSGKGVPCSFKEATRWCIKAAVQGNEKALNTLNPEMREILKLGEEGERALLKAVEDFQES